MKHIYRFVFPVFNIFTQRLLIVIILLFTMIGCDIEEPNEPPICNITAPTLGQEITIGVTTIISVDAEDSDGSITEVRFYIDGVEKNSLNSFPYTYSWETGNEDIGSHTIKATSYDNNGETTSDEISITLIAATGNCPTNITDYDGNTYSTVFIGTQCWMVENLKTTHYASGTLIPNVTSNSAWGALADNDTNDAYCYYNNDANGEANTYGALYTWAAAMGDDAVSSSTNPSGVQGACPTGWHLPSDSEWKQLEMQLGMSQTDADGINFRGTDQGSQLAGNSTLWNNGNLENNVNFDTSGFKALPGGYRHDYHGTFVRLGGDGYWWSSTEFSSTSAWYRNIFNNRLDVGRSTYYSKSSGISIRCTKD